VHVPDPLAAGDSAVDGLAAALAPRYRVLSVRSRGDVPYQVDAVDLVGVLGQFGFRTPVLVGERLGCVTALAVAAWYPERVAGLILLEPVFAAGPADRLAGRALRDCPPDVARLRAAVRCPVLERTTPTDVDDTARGAVEAFLAATLP
jgi:pimeloyl-ACP methyl ester carboxylesterase